MKSLKSFVFFKENISKEMNWWFLDVVQTIKLINLIDKGLKY